MNKVGYTYDEILEFMTEGEGRAFLGRSMYDAIRETIEEKDKEIERLHKELDYANNDNIYYIAKIDKALDFIDQVLQYHLQPFDYKQVDEDINTLIGILQGDDEE